MKGTTRIATIAGVPIRLHWSLVFLVLLAVGPGVTRSMALEEAGWLLAIFACVLVHELAHSVLARKRGFRVRDIVLMPLGGFSEIVGIASSPTDEALISLVGPITNLVIAALLTAIAASSGEALWPPTLFARAWLVRLLWANVALGALNLVPALPLDGGRVLRGYLGRSRDRATASGIAARIATTIAVVMILGGLLFDLWIALIGVVVYVGARAEERSATAGELLRGLRVRDAMIADTWGFDASATLEEAAPLLRQFPKRAFAVVDEGDAVGVISAVDLVAHPRATTVREATDSTAPILHADDDVYPGAFDAFAESGRPSLVVEEAGRPIGMLYESELETRLRQRRAQLTRGG